MRRCHRGGLSSTPHQWSTSRPSSNPPLVGSTSLVTSECKYGIPIVDSANNSFRDLNSVAYIAPAKDIAGCRGCVSADLEEKILQQTNRVHNVVTLVARSYYWIGLASNIDYKLEAGSATETQSFIESSVTGPTSGKTLILLRFREGSYVLKLFSNNKIIRAISIFVAPKRYGKRSTEMLLIY